MTTPAQDLAARLQAYAEAVEDWAHASPGDVAKMRAVAEAGRLLALPLVLFNADLRAALGLVHAHRTRTLVAASIDAKRLSWRAVVAAADAAEMGRAA